MTMTQTPRRPSTHQLVEVDEITGAFITQFAHGTKRQMDLALLDSLEDEINDTTGTRVEVRVLTAEDWEDMAEQLAWEAERGL